MQCTTGPGLSVSPRCDYLLRCPGPIHYSHYTHTSKSFNATAPNFASLSVFCFFSNIEKLELYTSRASFSWAGVSNNVQLKSHFYLETPKPILLHKSLTGRAGAGGRPNWSIAHRDQAPLAPVPALQPPDGPASTSPCH